MKSLERASRTAQAAALAVLMAVAMPVLAQSGTAASPAAAPVAAEEFGLDQLMGLLGRAAHGEAPFTEQRFVKGLDGPIEAAGVLHFTPPDRLERRVLTPRPESMRVDGNVMVLTRAGRTRTVTLDSLPELRGMVEALRGTLSGNAPQLKNYFKTQVSGDAAAWTLVLEPLDKALAEQLVSLSIRGTRGAVQGVTMQFVGGDHSVMTVSPPVPHKVP